MELFSHNTRIFIIIVLKFQKKFRRLKKLQKTFPVYTEYAQSRYDSRERCLQMY